MSHWLKWLKSQVCRDAAHGEIEREQRMIAYLKATERLRETSTSKKLLQSMRCVGHDLGRNIPIGPFETNLLEEKIS